MSASPDKSDETTRTPDKSPVVLLLGTLVDTTWRAFIPTIGGTFLGIGLDHLFRTTPWWTITTVTLGFALSIALIVMQLKNVRKK